MQRVSAFLTCAHMIVSGSAEGTVTFSEYLPCCGFVVSFFIRALRNTTAV